MSEKAIVANAAIRLALLDILHRDPLPAIYQVQYRTYAGVEGVEQASNISDAITAFHALSGSGYMSDVVVFRHSDKEIILGVATDEGEVSHNPLQYEPVRDNAGRFVAT